MRPIELFAVLVNQRLPWAPGAMLSGLLIVESANIEMDPSVVMRPMKIVPRVGEPQVAVGTGVMLHGL